MDIYEFPQSVLFGNPRLEIFSPAVGANKITSSGWMIAKDETEARDETIENVRGYQTFILRKSTNTSLYNTQDLGAAIHARVCTYVCVACVRTCIHTFVE